MKKLLPILLILLLIASCFVFTACGEDQEEQKETVYHSVRIGGTSVIYQVEDGKTVAEYMTNIQKQHGYTTVKDDDRFIWDIYKDKVYTDMTIYPLT